MLSQEQQRQQYDLVAAPLSELCGIVGDKLSDLCECIKSYAQSEGAMPCMSVGFKYYGSLGQSVNTYTLVNIFQVPVGQVGTSTRVSFAERWPGMFYGGAVQLMVNNTFDPAFPRLDHAAGAGMEHGLATKICLEEQDTVSLLVECWWTPIVYTGIPATYVQAMWPFEISGFFEPKIVV
jgi:hypothetical protein